jgi:hypothetical protein
MKQFLPPIMWFTVGSILGQFTESVLSPLWMRFGLLLPLGHWLDSFGSKSLNWCWLTVDVWLVSWLFVAAVSIVGGRFIRHYFLSCILLFGAGFAFVPLVLYSYLYSHIPTFADYWQHGIIFCIAVVCGIWSHSTGASLISNCTTTHHSG